MLSSDDERRFSFELARELGFSHPDELRAQLTSDEWASWCAWWDRKREGA